MFFTNHWDSAWYTKIIEHGYQLAEKSGGASSTAFYPLYPMVVKCFMKIMPFPIAPEVAGGIVSILFFSLSVFFIFFKFRNLNNDLFVYPEKNNVWGILFFLFAPASYIYVTHHTESLFLFLFTMIFYFSLKKETVLACVFAGLAALTKNQGHLSIFIVTGIYLAQQQNDLKRLFSKKFIGGVLIFAAIASLYPLFLWVEFGNPFQFILAQRSWSHVTSISEYFNVYYQHISYIIGSYKASVFTKPLYAFRIFFFFIFIYYIFVYYQKTKNLFVSLFFLLCLALMPAQKNLLTVYRFTVYFFPIYFMVGSLEGKLNNIIKAIILVTFVFLLINNTNAYYLKKWSY